MRFWFPVILPCLVLAACGRDIQFSPELTTGELPAAQPLKDEVRVDRIVQVTIPSVDVLFVVDNSCSMAEEQLALSTNFPVFLDYFLGTELDWHMGVVSTDMNDPAQSGRLRTADDVRWIDPDTLKPATTFAQMVALGTEGDATEQGIAAAYSAVERLAGPGGYNEGFIRNEAALHITVISDEDDSTNRFGGTQLISRSEFVEYLRTVRPAGRLTSFSSIVGPPFGCNDIGEPGSDYMAITEQVGGVIWPICTDDWSSVLDELGFLTSGLNREFFLAAQPVVDTIEVSATLPGGIEQAFSPDEWTYVDGRNAVRFLAFTPEPLTVVSIQYVVAASAVEN